LTTAATSAWTKAATSSDGQCWVEPTGRLTVNGTLKAGSIAMLPGPSGLIGYWPFNEGAGTSTSDLSGGAHPGAINANATWVNDGTRGWVLNFRPPAP